MTLFLSIALLLFIPYAMSQSDPRPAETIKSGLEMVLVQGGTYTMGGYDYEGDKDECPHLVEIEDFYIGKYEVTQRDWMEIMDDNPSFFEGCPECPVEKVSWYDIQQFIGKLNETREEHYRLPTEEEWEYAARGGSKTGNFRYSGSNDLAAVAWYSNNSSGRSHPVGLLDPNELGLYDMSGNIWEWCGTIKKPYPCDKSPLQTDIFSIRGGMWASAPHQARLKERNGRIPHFRHRTLGFRLAKSDSE